MEINYTIAAADGQTYGPVSLQELQTWIRDGRVGAQTNVMRSDVNAWYAASQYQELSFQTAATPPLAATTQYTAARRTFVEGQFPELEKKIKNGAGWFYWIAGLSMISAGAITFGANWAFFLGLGVAQAVAFFGQAAGTTGRIVSLAISAVICGLFVMFGIFAHKRHTWAFIVGLVLYLLDSLIFLLVQDWAPFGFHIFAAFCIFVGLKANLDLKKELRI